MRRGLGLLAGAAALVLAVGALASPELFALTIGMVAITLGAGVSVLLAAHRLAVARSVPQREACEDQTLRVHLALRGLGQLPVPVHLQAQVAADRWVPLGEGGGTVELMVGRRGAWQLGPSRLRLRDCLGLFERSLLVGEPEPLLILPTPDLAVRVPPRRLAQRGARAPIRSRTVAAAATAPSWVAIRAPPGPRRRPTCEGKGEQHGRLWTCWGTRRRTI